MLPEELGECWLERLAERWGGGCGGEPPAERGEPGGNVSVTDMSAAIGEGPAAAADTDTDTDTGGDAPARLSGEPAEPLLKGPAPPLTLVPYPENHRTEHNVRSSKVRNLPIPRLYLRFDRTTATSCECSK